MGNFVSAVAAGDNNVAFRQEAIRINSLTASRAFVSPKGDHAWGQNIFNFGLGIDVCRNAEMRKGWVDASKKK